MIPEKRTPLRSGADTAKEEEEGGVTVLRENRSPIRVSSRNEEPHRQKMVWKSEGMIISPNVMRKIGPGFINEGVGKSLPQIYLIGSFVRNLPALVTREERR